MKEFNIYMCGVGGQGIGLLAEMMIRTCSKAGYEVKGVDTHGLAQRGGTVVSHLRIGKKVHTPLVPPGQADIVIALERLEALRAVHTMMKDEGKVIFYDVRYQTVDNRLGTQKYPDMDEFEIAVKSKHGQVVRVFRDDVPDPRMQNVVLISELIKLEWIDGFSKKFVVESLTELMQGKGLEKNLKLL
ncbi:MAG: 2-oxoacid:acceptor oxidoreductase family protein [Candidatus Delongbacteria bacterium]|nr:2-oxoacid:acceptor oxidoreductase family protein [Candidatus Delongbacteria bacterium]